jgi:alpha-glucoside transport system permease protein
MRRPARAAYVLLVPAVVMMGVYIVYPIGYAIVHSLLDADPVVVGNFADAYAEETTRRALGNTVVWVVLAPSFVLAMGVLLAVLTERVRWAAVVRLALLLPMTLSLVASGVVIRLVYERDPDRGLLNAAAVAVHDVVTGSGDRPALHPRAGTAGRATSDAYLASATVAPGDVIAFPLAGAKQGSLPAASRQAVTSSRRAGEIRGSVWLDVSAGQAVPGTVDGGERGVGGVRVDAMSDGHVVASAVTGDDGRFAIADVPGGRYRLRLSGPMFVEPFRGVTWLGPGLITPVLIVAWIWLMTGVATVAVAAGLAGIPAETREAARMDGATEWQVLRRVTLPLLWRVLAVIAAALVVNVLKIFELVYVVAAPPLLDDAGVIGVRIWEVSFGVAADPGIGSALVVSLLLLLVPAAVVHIRRFRRDRR